MDKTVIKRKNNNIILLVAVLFITTFIYLSSLTNHQVADSWVFLYPHTFSQTIGYFHQSIIPDEWNAQWLRPIPMIFFWVDNKIWPKTDWGPNLINLLFHLFNIVLIWRIMHFIRVQSSSKTELKYGIPEFIACIVYAIHPLNVGAVAWSAARFDVMSVTFGLSGLFFWLKWDAFGRKPKELVLSCFFLILSILSKEQGVIFTGVCLLMSLYAIFAEKKDIRANVKSIIALLLMCFVYVIYRYSVFKGMGGYLESAGITFIPPFAYFFAIIFPYINIPEKWALGVNFWMAYITIIVLTIIIWIVPLRYSEKIKTGYIFGISSLFILGLLSTIPHTGLGFGDILGHAESRFALIGVIGFALILGIISNRIIKSIRAYKIMIAIIFIWTISAIWRTDVQIDAWKNAGNVANGIIINTLKEAPNPPTDSHFYFFDIPRGNNQYAYIFGIGLKEAIMVNYPGRNDIVIKPDATGKDLRSVIPTRDYVFGFNKKQGELERLFPSNRTKN